MWLFGFCGSSVVELILRIFGCYFRCLGKFGLGVLGWFLS